MENSALIISSLALLFTVFSFWWMNWRTGRLEVGKPRSFAATGSDKGLLIILLPIVFFNNGPIPILVQNLRLIFPDEEDTTPLFFNATRAKLGDPKQDDFATQFPVKGREAILLHCQFHRTPGHLVFQARRYRLVLEGKLGNKKKWQKLSEFELNITEKSLQTINRLFVAHDNMVED